MSKTETTLPSGLMYGDKDLVDCSHAELVRAVKTAMDERNEARTKEKALLDLLRTPFPVHALWKGFAEWCAICLFALGALHEVVK